MAGKSGNNAERNNAERSAVMNEIKCLYCSGYNKPGEDICHICGLPISMSMPMDAVEAAEAVATPQEKDSGPQVSAQKKAAAAANNGGGQKAILQDAWSQFQQSRAELAAELETKEPSNSKTKIVIIV